MNRRLAILLSLLLVFSLCACNHQRVDEAEQNLFSPFDANAYVGMDHEKAESALRGAGFECIDLRIIEDVNTDNMLCDGSVESISINGITDYTTATPFARDAVIEISYHSVPMIVVPENALKDSSAHYLQIGKAFFDVGFTTIETDEVYDLPPGTEYRTVITADEKPIEESVPLPINSSISILGHYPIHQYLTKIDIDFESNWIFSKYGVVVALNGEELGSLAHGEDAFYELNLPAGNYTLSFTKQKDENVSGSISFDINSRTEASYHISCDSDEVKVEETTFTQALTEGNLLMPYSYAHYLRSDYPSVVEELENLGFTNITAHPVVDHLWNPSPINSVVEVVINGISNFESDTLFSNSRPVDVYYHVSDFAFEKASIQVTEKESFELPYTLNSGDSVNSLSFKIDDPSVLQRNGDGSYTALTPGTATVAVLCGGEKYSTCTVEVAEIVVPIERIILPAEELDVIVGSSFTLNYSIYPENANYKEMTCTLSNAKLEQMENNSFYATEAGDTEIKFYQDDRVLGTCVVHSVAVDIEELVVDDTKEISVGETVDLPFSLLPQETTCKGILVKSSQPDVAEVDFDERGVPVVKVKGNAPGKAVISITIPNGNSYSCSVTVKEVLPTEISLTNAYPDKKIEIGTLIFLEATWAPENVTYKEISWSTSNRHVIRINDDGSFEAVGVGTADITAKHKSGVTGTITLVVEPTPATQILLESDWDEDKSFVPGDRCTITATILPENATDKSVRFSSDDESVVKVSEKGVVTAVSVGSATITAISPDGPSEKIDIYVDPPPQKFQVYWSTTRIEDYHGGSGYSQVLYINDEIVYSGSIVSLSPDSYLSISLVIFDSDSNPDTGYYNQLLPYSEDLCKNGFSDTSAVYVYENGGPGKNKYYTAFETNFTLRPVR